MQSLFYGNWPRGFPPSLNKFQLFYRYKILRVIYGNLPNFLLAFPANLQKTNLFTRISTKLVCDTWLWSSSPLTFEENSHRINLHRTYNFLYLYDEAS